MSRLTRDGTAEPVSRDQILRHARGQGNVHFPCSADHEQDWQPYPVDPYSAICDDHTYIHTIDSTTLNMRYYCGLPVLVTDYILSNTHEVLSSVSIFPLHFSTTFPLYFIFSLCCAVAFGTIHSFLRCTPCILLQSCSYCIIF